MARGTLSVEFLVFFFRRIPAECGTELLKMCVEHIEELFLLKSGAAIAEVKFSLFAVNHLLNVYGNFIFMADIAQHRNPRFLPDLKGLYHKDEYKLFSQKIKEAWDFSTIPTGTSPHFGGDDA